MFAEYIWIDGTNPTATLRSKTRILASETTPPPWSFDGSSTHQAPGDASDRLLVPVHSVPDPIRQQDHQGEPHMLVLCEVCYPDETPHESNHRAELQAVLDAGADKWGTAFGFEQEYTLFQGSRPLGFPQERRFPVDQGPYYCGVGADEVYGRQLVEAHMQACVAAGLDITGINAEVMPGQWEFQIGGPEVGPLRAADHVWIARWLLYRLGEDFGVSATLDPKPVPGSWNGAGMHCNFSTIATRATPNKDPSPGALFGIEAIIDICETLGHRTKEHLEAYGHGYEMRLTGASETCHYSRYRYGPADRTVSVRIPQHVVDAKCGYLEDRRPNANADPYQVATVMLKTACGLW